MERDASPIGHEAIDLEQLEAIKSEFAFANPMAMDNLRAQTKTEMDTAAGAALGGDASFNPSQLKHKRAEAIDEVVEQSDESYKSYTDSAYDAAGLDKEEDSELYDRILGMLQATSVKNMTQNEWYKGPIDADGNFDRNQSGFVKAHDTFEQLCKDILVSRPAAEEDAPEEEGDDAETHEDGPTLEEARKKLAELSIERRRILLKGGKKSKELEEEFNAAQADYDEAFLNAGVDAVRAMRDDGLEEDDIHAAVIWGTVAERRDFAAAEAAVLAADDSKIGRLAKWLGNSRNLIITNAATGVAVGYGVKRLVKGAAGAASGLALPVAIGVGIAARTTKAVLSATVGNRSNQVKMHEKRANEDIAEVEERALSMRSDIEGRTDDQMAGGALRLLRGNIGERVEKDVDSNRKRVAKAGMVALVGAGAGVLLADALDSGLADNKSAANLGPDVTPDAPELPIADAAPAAPPLELPEVPDHGFTADVTVEAGNGFTGELQDLAAQRGINLSGQDSYELYEYLEGKYQGNLLQNGGTYLMSDGNYGISNPGAATWRPEVLADIDQWMRLHEAAQLENAA